MADKCTEFPSDLSNLKYADLRKLAKKFGIKANVKAEKLVEALAKYSNKEAHVTEASGAHQDLPTSSDDDGKPQVFSPVVRKKRSRKTDKHQDFNLDVFSSVESVLQTNQLAGRAKSVGNNRDRVDSSADKVDRLEDVSFRKNDDEEDDEIVFNFKEKKTDVQTPASQVSNVATGIVGSSSRKRHSTYTIEDGRGVHQFKTTSIQVPLDVKPSAPVKKTSNIPRFSQKAHKSGTKTFTADYWAKLHQKQFDQMDSLDVYVEKRTKRALALLSPNCIAGSRKKEEKKEKQTAATKGTAATNPSAPAFVPTVFSTTSMNTNFSQMFQKEIRRSTAQKIIGSERPQAASPVVFKAKAPVSLSKRKSRNTPFQGAQPSPANSNSTNKPKFDLQASLARPITWKPYVGKLKESYTKDLRVDVKKVTVKTRDDRRKEANNARAKRRLDLQHNRRGIVSQD